MARIEIISETKIYAVDEAYAKIFQLVDNYCFGERVIQTNIYDMEDQTVQSPVIIAVTELQDRKAVYVPSELNNAQIVALFEKIFLYAKKNDKYIVFSSNDIEKKLMERLKTRGIIIEEVKLP